MFRNAYVVEKMWFGEGIEWILSSNMLNSATAMEWNNWNWTMILKSFSITKEKRRKIEISGSLLYTQETNIIEWNSCKSPVNEKTIGSFDRWSYVTWGQWGR